MDGMSFRTSYYFFVFIFPRLTPALYLQQQRNPEVRHVDLEIL